VGRCGLFFQGLGFIGDSVGGVRELGDLFTLGGESGGGRGGRRARRGGVEGEGGVEREFFIPFLRSGLFI